MLDDIMSSAEKARLGEEITQNFGEITSFFERVVRGESGDLIGLLGADWLRFRRSDNLANLLKRTKARLEALGVDRECATTLTLVLPIFRAAADESREELLELWARLLAATVDPLRCIDVRREFAEAIAKMDPPDAKVLAHLDDVTTRWSEKEAELGLSRDQLQISLSNLHWIGVLSTPTLDPIVTTPFGREFVRVVVR